MSADTARSFFVVLNDLDTVKIALLALMIAVVGVAERKAAYTRRWLTTASLAFAPVLAVSGLAFPLKQRHDLPAALPDPAAPAALGPVEDDQCRPARYTNQGAARRRRHFMKVANDGLPLPAQARRACVARLVGMG